ncbi:Zinc (Zn2)Iron (Fe2) Permease (ZIP) Family [Paramicrosporidium saccamoebae]|uniref:Zinc (Zn2)Iron (Fe2) Permease (ZIP) Family n=1 Tax=Paramicrosporidium saccamoebae TaxID=1246581 RepID=A0A2H9TM33_9FUNG|nr:Zinc (Zn2)Iron (Fe2) Permease (ZIP) Family [Paramicrosporidium saccamoebae]
MIGYINAGPFADWSVATAEMLYAIAPILATIVISVVPISVLLFLPTIISSPPRRKSTGERGSMISSAALNLMLCFASGSLVADALLHLLADSIFGDFPSEENTKKQALATVIGIFVFFAMDVITRSFQHHDPLDHDDTGHSEHQGSILLAPSGSSNVSRRKRANGASPDLQMLSTGKPSPSPERHAVSGHACTGNGLLSLVADAIHNFTDGLALAAAFGKDFRLGCKTTLAIFLHEVPHELGDYAILAKAGFSHRRIIFMQFLTATAAFLGVFCGVAIHNGWLSMGHFIKEDNLLPFAAGGFLYVALCTILPEVLTDTRTPRTFLSSISQIVVFLAGVLLMVILE